MEFTQTARKHKVGRERVRHVLANPVAFDQMDSAEATGEKWLLLGADHDGRPLEVVVVIEENRWVVIHVMDLREKYRTAFEKGMRK